MRPYYHFGQQTVVKPFVPLVSYFSFSVTVFKSLLIYVVFTKTAEKDFHWGNSTLKPWRLKCPELVHLFLLYREGVTKALLLFTRNCFFFFFIAVYKAVCLRKINSNQDSIRIYVVWSQFVLYLHYWIFFISSEHTGTSYQWKCCMGLSGVLSNKVGCFQCINCVLFAVSLICTTFFFHKMFF